MRRRALFIAAAAIAGLGFATASPATAAGHGVTVFTPSGGTPIPTNANCPISVPVTPPRTIPFPQPSINCARAGYQASGRDFRFAQALITVPDHPGTTCCGAHVRFDGVSGPDPVLYVALDNSSASTYQYTRVGIAPCPEGVADVFIVPGGTVTCPTTVDGNTSNWVAFAATVNTGIPPGSPPNPPTPPNVVIEPLSSAVMGDGILVNAYLAPTGNAVQTVIQLPDGTTYNNTFRVTGPVYTRAQALGDWTTALENGASQPEPTVPDNKRRVSQFFQGRFTTASGQQGTFAGPWTLNALEVTSNGELPPTGTLMTQPSYLWNDNHGFNGLGQDAFGVWSYPF
jgi:hypothetical protein